MDDKEHDERFVFPSDLGWMSLSVRGDVVLQLTFGGAKAAAALGADAGRVAQQAWTKWQRDLVRRLQRYAEGAVDDFCDLAVDTSSATEFQARVLKCCREIPYGRTITYGELAAKARAPGAARAVGNCMAGNRIPLIIPCHRVVRAGGDIGPYSAAGGSATKRRLLRMEATSFPESLEVLAELA